MKKIIERLSLDTLRFGISGSTLITLVISVAFAVWRASGWTSDIIENSESIVEIRAEQSVIKGDVSDIKSDISDIKGDVKGMVATLNLITDLVKKN